MLSSDNNAWIAIYYSKVILYKYGVIMSKNKYMNDISIDPHALEQEWMDQPALYHEYSQLTVAAQKEKDKAKQKLDICKSRLDLDIRKHPEKYDLPKIVEATVLSTIQIHPDYIDAMDKHTNAVYQYNMLSNTVYALEHKKKALENMVSLWLGSYFAGPKEPKIIEPGKRMLARTVDDVCRSKTTKKQVERLKPITEEATETKQTTKILKRRRR